MGAAIKSAVDNQRAAHASAKRGKESIIQTPAGSVKIFTERHGVDVVININRQTESFAHDRSQRHAGPSGHIGQVVNKTPRKIRKSRHAYADTMQLMAGSLTGGDSTADQVKPFGLRCEIGGGVTFFSQNTPVFINKADFDGSAPEINTKCFFCHFTFHRQRLKVE